MPQTRLLKFVQLLPRVPRDGDFRLKDLPGSGGRIDILCRDLAACFDWAPENWPKEGLELVALVANSVSLTFKDPSPELPIGERAWAEIIRSSLRGNPPSFVTVRETALEEFVYDLVERPENKVWVLDEKGVPISGIKLWDCSTQNSFMLGDHVGFDSRARWVIRKFDLPRVSLGATSYLSSHCIANVISASEREI